MNERRQRRDTDRLTAIVQSSDDAIFSKDLNGIVTTWNPAAERLYGWTAEEMIGRPISTIIPADHEGEEMMVIDRITRGERIDHYETVRQTKDGRLVEISLTASPIHEDAELVGASVIARDITERKRFEEIQKNLDLLEFLGKIVHEFRTPLTAISGMAELLAMHESLSEDQAEQALNAIRRQSRRCQNLIDDLLDLIRIRTPEFSIEPRSVGLSKVIADALATSTPPEEVTVETDLTEDLQVWVDPDRLEQILVNLLVNAHKYGGPRVTVSARTEGERVRVEVADNGPGVPEELVPALFDPFTRGRSEVIGSGLGLAIVKRLVEALGGDVTYEGAEGQGARFAFTLERAG